MPYMEPEKPKKKKKTASSRDIALDKLDFYSPPKPKGKKEDKIKGRPKNAVPMLRNEPHLFLRKTLHFLTLD